jgi:hypothetical protein
LKKDEPKEKEKKKKEKQAEVERLKTDAADRMKL